jgi:hypothetical protein
MRKRTLALAAAIVLTTALAGANAQTPAFGKSEAVTVSPEDLQQRIDGRSLPLMYIEEPY